MIGTESNTMPKATRDSYSSLQSGFSPTRQSADAILPMTASRARFGERLRHTTAEGLAWQSQEWAI